MFFDDLGMSGDGKMDGFRAGGWSFLMQERRDLYDDSSADGAFNDLHQGVK